MKRILLVLLIMILLIFGACGKNDVPVEAMIATPDATPTGTPAPTPAPDFSGTDFSGTWYVAEIIDSVGQKIDENEIQSLGGDFTLEMLNDGVYFVYDEKGAVLGQGEYSIMQNQLTLTAADAETFYEIQDEDTLCCTSSDGSITVMKHIVIEDEQEVSDESDSDEQDDADEEDTVDASDILEGEPTTTT